MYRSFVYILTNKYRTTFYIGVTANLERRVLEHIEGKASVFTTKYNIRDLIYFEAFNEIEQAIAREKQLKNWHKEWKLNLIRENNPELKTLDIFN